MIGVSTEQNTTNVLPALQHEIDAFAFIETSLAKNNEWSVGAIEVFKTHKIEILNPIRLDKAQDSRIDLIVKRLKNFLNQNKNYRIVWNIGGGQKAQQMALWQVFSERSHAGQNDTACYSNPGTEEIECWRYNDKILSYSSEPVKSTLKAIEILKIFGFRTQNTGTPLSDFKSNPDRLKLWQNPTFRKYFYLLPNGTDLRNSQTLEIRDVYELIELNIDEISKNQKQFIKQRLGSSDKPISREYFYTNFIDEFSKRTRNFIKIYFSDEKEDETFTFDDDRFEQICKSKNIECPVKLNRENFSKLTGTIKSAIFFENLLFEIVKRDFSSSAYSDCLLNVKVYPNSSGNFSAEYDVLLATKAGKLISLDAKTFDFPRKDADTRLLNISKAGGKYVKFIPVLPYDKYDCETEYYPDKLIALINRLEAENSEYYIVPSITDEQLSFTLQQKNQIFNLKSIAIFFR